MEDRSMSADRQRLSATLRSAVYVTAVIDLVIGLLFLFGPESGVLLWPTPIAPVLTRFIGGIVIANGVAAWVVARQNTWEGARALFTVAIVYGVVVLVALLYHLLLKNADPVFWIYCAVDGIFLVPIIYTYYLYERARATSG